MMAPSSLYRYVILGAGRQGTSAAYDLARFGDAKQIVLADISATAAAQAAERINRLLNREVAKAQELDIANAAALRDALSGADVVLSAVPYYHNVDIARAAIDAGVHMCDMGGNTDIVEAQLALDVEARQAGVSIVPDCGMAPGLSNTMGAWALDLLDEPRELYVYDGGIPQEPQPPWNYQITFHVNGLTNEYDIEVPFLRDGEIIMVEGLSEYEIIDLPPHGTFEAFAAATASTAPWSFRDRVRTYESRVVRYLGHREWFIAFKTLGLFGLESIQVGDQTVVPREFFHALLEPKITAPLIKDVCYIYIKAVGKHKGTDTTLIIDLADYYDEETGFTAMERLTGWHCAIMMGFQARGKVRAGGIPQETAVPPAEFMEEVRKRGILFELRYET